MLQLLTKIQVTTPQSILLAPTLCQAAGSGSASGRYEGRSAEKTHATYLQLSFQSEFTPFI